MEYKGYEIVHYRPELNEQIVNLMQYLWKGDRETNLSYFDWKYINNPSTEQPLGIAALYKGRVAGFRGYFATKWFIGKKDKEFTILCPGDTCVHPEHREKGLSVAMGKLAAESYSSRYNIFFNMSSTTVSVPGYLRMNFEPLLPKHYISRFGLYGLIKYILKMKQSRKLEDGSFVFGEFGRVIVSNGPMPNDMSSVIKKIKHHDNKIRLYQDEDFFKWRYSNKKNKYLFYYFKQDEIITGYIVIGISPNNRRGYILDYAESDDKALDQILRYIKKVKQFDILSVYSFGVSDRFQQILNVLQFKKNNLLRILEKAVYDECPLFIRPINNDFTENDWAIHDQDTRKVENWAIKPIASDAV